MLANEGDESGRFGETPRGDSIASTESGGSGEATESNSGISTSGRGRSGTSSKDGHGIDDEFQLGDYKYRITGARQQSYVGNEFINERASAGATFLIVS